MTDKIRTVVIDPNLNKLVTIQADMINLLEAEKELLEQRVKLAEDTMDMLREKGII